MDPEFTAQPRPISDEIALEDSGTDDGLSVDPEDLGSHFLAEAVEQGYVASDPGAQSEASLFEAPAGDEPLVGPNFEADRTIWEQTVDLSLQAGNDARQLRGPAFIAGDDFEDRGRGIEDMKTAPVDIEQSGARDVSLFDREDDVDSDEPDTDDEVAVVRDRRRAQPAGEQLENVQSNARVWLFGATRRMLLGTADVLRSLARRLSPGHKHSPTVAMRKPPASVEERSIPHLPIG